jgi:putative peptidoglycan lipid II flippase
MSPLPDDARPADIRSEPAAGEQTFRAGSGIAFLALIIMVGNVFSRVLGLVREQLAASLFGTGDAIAAFTVADNLQTLLFDLMVSGALQAALVPVLTQWAAPDLAIRREFRQIGGTLIVLASLVLGGLAVAGMAAAPDLVEGLVWFSGQPDARGEETRELTIRLVRIVLPAAVLLGIGTLLQAMLFAMGRVAAPALSTAVRNLTIIIGAVALSAPLGVESMAWGTTAGALAIVLIQIWPLARAGALPILGLDLRHPALRQMLALYVPVFLGLLFNSAAVVVDRGLAWGAGEHALGAMRYATTLVQLVLGIVAAAISLASLPALSRHFSANDEFAYGVTLGRSLTLVTVLIFPATFGLAALSTPIASLLFGYGATDDTGVRQITLALLGYLPGTLAAAYDQVLIFAFYARRNTRTPVLIGVLSVGVYFLVAFATVDAFGMMGLVVANSVQFIVHAGLMWWLARQGFGWTAQPRLAVLIPRCGAAALAMALAAWLTWWTLDLALPGRGGMDGAVVRRLLLVGVPAGIATAVYLAGVWTVMGDELRTMIRAIRQRLPLPG